MRVQIGKIRLNYQRISKRYWRSIYPHLFVVKEDLTLSVEDQARAAEAYKAWHRKKFPECYATRRWRPQSYRSARRDLAADRRHGRAIEVVNPKRIAG